MHDESGQRTIAEDIFSKTGSIQGTPLTTRNITLASYAHDRILGDSFEHRITNSTAI